MGRIEDALRRAAGKGGTDPVAPRPDHERLETPFVSPWRSEPPLTPDTGRRPGRPDGLGAELKRLGPLRVEGRERMTPSSTVRLESQLAMNWPQPFSSDVAERLVVMRETDPAAVEQYGRLAGALQEIQSERGVKSVMIASAVAGEGRTLTAVNLALTLSQALGRRVLLIDADSRRPWIHTVFQVTRGPSLNDLAVGGPLPAIELTSTLSLFSIGLSEPGSGVLGSDRMRQVIVDASQAFDWVVLDSGPVLLVPDMNLLAAMVDLGVLVVEAGKTTYSRVAQAVNALGRDRVAGVVLNGVDPGRA